jgi:hypothetical protein
MKDRIKNNVLVLLIFLTIWTVPTVSAGYLNQKKSSNTARVASFQIKDEGTWSTYADATISPGNTVSNSSPIKIKNASEVAVECTLTITRYTHNIKNMEPSNIKLGDGEMVLADNTEEDSKTWQYTQTLQPSQEVTSDLKITWESSTSNPDENLQYMGMVDYFTVTVSAKQVD